MAIDTFQVVLNEIHLLHHQFAAMIDAGFLIFARLLGFMLIGPVFGRKDLPFALKINIALFLTLLLVWSMPGLIPQKGMVNSENVPWYTIQILMNVTVGMLIGFIGAAVMEAISAAGSMMNNQIGLSSAMMFDPSTRQQVALTEKMTAYLGLLVFFSLGGMYWILDALHRSFEVFPAHVIQMNILQEIQLDYLIRITGNSLEVGTQLVAPVMVVTMAVDLILGVVNRTAQQIQVFQLSFALKPTIGMGVFLITLPIFIKLLENYLTDYARLF